MRLIEYMEREGLDDRTFAARFNANMPKRMRCGVHAVKKWKYGERRPDPDGILRIEVITSGEVTLRDWVRLPTRRQARPTRKTLGLNALFAVLIACEYLLKRRFVPATSEQLGLEAATA